MQNILSFQMAQKKKVETEIYKALTEASQRLIEKRQHPIESLAAMSIAHMMYMVQNNIEGISFDEKYVNLYWEKIAIEVDRLGFMWSDLEFSPKKFISEISPNQKYMDNVMKIYTSENFQKWRVILEMCY